jgi:hypothetical protein
LATVGGAREKNPGMRAFPPGCPRGWRVGGRGLSSEPRACKRCRKLFFPVHGNSTVCASCKVARVARRPLRVDFGVRRCVRCWREYVATVEFQKFCSAHCRYLARKPQDRALYANPVHRGARRRLEPVVASGRVRCARGAACQRAEFVDGLLVGGLIRPGEAWHLGHPDHESVGGPEHRACNVAGANRLRAKARP